MLISELIAELERLKAEHGDVPVLCPVNGYDVESPCECSGATFYPSHERDKTMYYSPPWNRVYHVPACVELRCGDDWDESNPRWAKTDQPPSSGA